MQEAEAVNVGSFPVAPKSLLLISNYSAGPFKGFVARRTLPPAGGAYDKGIRGGFGKTRNL